MLVSIEDSVKIGSGQVPAANLRLPLLPGIFRLARLISVCKPHRGYNDGLITVADVAGNWVGALVNMLELMARDSS